MIRKTIKRKKISVALTIVISLVMITAVLTSCFSQSSFRSNTYAIISQLPKQSSFPNSVIGINETNILNETNLINNSSSPQPNTNPVSLEPLKPITYTYGGYSVQQLDRIHFFFSFPDYINQNQIRSDATLPTNATNNLYETISLETSNFTTYTYGGYPVQQPNIAQFNFSFPDNTNQGQMAGSDALTLNTYAIQKIDFDAAFIAPKITALGFDEMTIFATSNTITYKGVEFGVRMDLNDGFVYGYIQEPNDNHEDVNFLILKLMPNDGIIHHYALVDNDSGVSFFVDGIDQGYLNFPSDKDYSNLAFSILAVVHRFTDYWDSNGDSMIAGNFSLNQQ